MDIKQLQQDIEKKQKIITKGQHGQSLSTIRSVYDKIIEKIQASKERALYESIIQCEIAVESEHMTQQQVDKGNKFGTKEEQKKLQIAIENEYRTKLNAQFALDELYGRKRMKKSLSMDDIRLTKINNRKIEENNLNAIKTQNKWQTL